MDKEFWDDRWANQNTGWDMGEVSPPLKAYFDQLKDKELRILIPGAGNAYEAEYLHKKGFKNVYVIDISQGAVDSFYERVPDFPAEHIKRGDFFQLTGVFDLIVEQTFYCAIQPNMRNNYVMQAYNLLKSGGKIIGLLFDFPLESGPPFGGSYEEYKKRFENYFNLITLEKSHNSIKPREDREFFFIAQKP
ncbi:MAG: TPMT family class I SAM-dependent methyltransferase [Crocinitomicaceae bacterium]|nr:TPMT family class I SAM-dependent methyltransferase [Crocinitomicaceae bacterium]